MAADFDFSLRTLLRLAWPIVLSRAAQAVIGFCDAVMTAPLGEDALAAVTAGSLNVLCLVMLPFGIAFMVQSFAAQMLGRGDAPAARRFGWYGILFSLVAGVIYLGVIPWVRPVVGWLHYAPSVQDLMSDYIGIRFLSIAAVVGIEAVGNWYGGLGNTRFQMIASLVMMLANVLLNWMLIEGHWGAPALGVPGAAWASVFATGLGFAILLGLFLFRVGFAGPEAWALDRREFFRMLRFGLPNGLNWFLEFSAFMFFINVVVADLGTTITAALLAVVQINSVSFMPAFGISSAGAILSGQAIGAGRIDEVRAILWRTMKVTASWQGAVGAIYLFAPATLMGAFSGGQTGAMSELVALGTVLLAWSAAWQLFDSIGMTVSEILRSAGDTTFSLLARVSAGWFVFIPMSYVLVSVLDGGAIAAMISIIVYMALLAVILGLRFRNGAWKHIEMTQDSVSVPG